MHLRHEQHRLESKIFFVTRVYAKQMQMLSGPTVAEPASVRHDLRTGSSDACEGRVAGSPCSCIKQTLFFLQLQGWFLGIECGFSDGCV